MRWATTAAAVEAAATGLFLLASPWLFGWLIFGDEMSDAGQALGRLTGVALLGFASTSWPDPSARSVARAMLGYICSRPSIFFIWVSWVSRRVCCYGPP